MKNIAIFCSANNDLDEKYVKSAEEFANLIAKNGYHIVWGGGSQGLMKAIASVAKKGGSKLIGISIPVYKHFIPEDADEKIITETLGERKLMMLNRCDAIVAMVGGIGTLDEVTEVIELRKQKHHNKPIVIINTENFYEGLRTQLQVMKDNGFIDNSLDELVYFAKDPQEAIKYINKNLK